MDTVEVDPEVAPALEAVPHFQLTVELLPIIRSSVGQMMGTPELSDRVERTNHVIGDDPAVFVRVHRPVGVTGTLPCVYSMHGGGYVAGRAEAEDAKFDAWAAQMPCVGVSVEYRLAPETPYPGPLEDCYDGLRWVYEHHAELGVDRDRIGIAGGSAGAGLAAALAILTRDRGEIPLRFQLLDSAMLDDRQVTSSSRRDELPVWSRESNEFGWRSYLGELYGRDDVPGTAVPARARDLTNLPPAFVIVGGADGFRDEGIEYAMRLGQAGVQTELHVFPGIPHGVHGAPGSPPAVRWSALVDDWLARQLAG